MQFLGLAFFVVPCQIKQSKNNTNTPKVSGVADSSKKTEQFSIIDTLNKYQNTDSLFEYKSHRIYTGKINDVKIGLVQTSDTTTILYQKMVGNWTITDTINQQLLFVLPIDLNGDNYRDLVVTYNFTGSGANSQNICLLYYPTTNQFRHNKHFDLPNIHYDRKSNLVFSVLWSGVTGPQEKMAYILTGDSLIFKEGVILQPDEATQGDSGIVEFYKIQGNKRIVSKRIKGLAEEIFEIFTKALWDSSDE